MSKVFTFRLEAPLRQRVRHEQAMQMALANAMQTYHEAIRVADETAETHRQAQRDAAATGAVTDWAVRTNLLYYLDRLGRQLEQQRRIAGQCETEVARIQGLVVEAAQRRRALERLRERQEEEYTLELVRRQDHELDEGATLRYARAAMTQGGFDAR